MNDIDYCKWWVPESLLIFLQRLILSELEQVSIRQCIAQTLRSTSILVLVPFGIGVDTDKSLATRWLVDQIALLGLSTSSDEVKLFKQSAAVSDSMEATVTEHFRQWVGDNVEHNIRTLTGIGTFHGMGIISIHSNSNNNFKAISRRQHKSVTNLAGCGMKVDPYYGDSYRSLQKQYFTAMANLASTTLSASGMTLDFLWHTA